MKVLYIARLFSGLETSVINGRWRPTGVPTIYKFIETLDARCQALTIVLTSKDGFTRWTRRDDVEQPMSGLRAKLLVLAGAGQRAGSRRKIGAMTRELRQIWKILRLCAREQPDVIYVDHGNVWAAGLLARIARAPVVFRIMGVYPAMRAALSGWRPAHILLRWCYRAPYAAAICTQDGSGAEPWLERALSPGTPRHLLINGVDLGASSADPGDRLARLRADRTVILFLGKLENAKGSLEFLSAFLAARRVDSGLHALIIGDGALKVRMQQDIDAAGAGDDVTLIDKLPHAEVAVAMRRADIYVSLNRLGNLSNANLEAVRSGKCVIMPRSQPDLAVDTITDSLIPADAASRIADAADISGLTREMLALHRDPARRQRMERAMAAAAQRFIPSWAERLDREFSILEEIGRAPKTTEQRAGSMQS